MKLSHKLPIKKIITLLALLAPVAQAYESVPGEFVVKLKGTPNSKSLNTFEEVARSLQKRLGTKSSPQVRHFKTSEQFATIVVQGSSNSKEIQKLLSSDDRVAYAEPNYIYHAFGTRDSQDSSAAPVNDDKFAQLWGMHNTGQTDASGQVGKSGSDIRVVPVWNQGITGSKNVKVAIIDTGVDYNHPDLKANIMANPGEIAGDGIDNDHNGFVDDVYGWDFANNQANGLDDQNHGSHCAGTIGGVGNNNLGVVGVNWNVSIIPVKFLNSAGSGTLDAAVQAIQYANSLNVNIMSNSWGGGPYTQALLDAIQETHRKGVLFVAAAGNDSNNNDSNPSYPASYQVDNVISVAATDNRDLLASFSNFGRTKVHVAAPGVKILSTVKGGGYDVYSGTSMATPHVAGIAALLWSTNPGYSAVQIKDILIKTSDKVRALSKKVVSRGRVNVYNAIHGIEPVDNTPAENLWKDYAYSVESPHPYENSKTYQYDIHVPNAKYIRVVFESIDTEAGYDKISVKESNGDEIENISGNYASGYTTDYLTGSKASIVFKTDSSVNKNGFKVQKLQVIY